MAEVAVIYGSTSDEDVMQDAFSILDEFGIMYERAVLSAHRQPEETANFAHTAADKGIKIISLVWLSRSTSCNCHNH